jgi:hypothetical protein
MKRKFPIWLSLLICLGLVLFGLVYGNVSGYSDERSHVVALLEGDGGLLTAVDYRGSDGLNLCVVAQRHLSADDADVAALRAAAEAVKKDDQSLNVVKAEVDTLAEAFAAVSARLSADAGFNASTRDTQYLQMLTADFSENGEGAIFETYNTAAAAFNAKLDTAVLGDVARFFGVKALDLYE